MEWGLGSVNFAGDPAIQSLDNINNNNGHLKYISDNKHKKKPSGKARPSRQPDAILSEGLP
jgi:hypothetical protein